MREVNFSIPSANKAAVSITTALYDRRALDCTSDLPLINSLNNLAYLTTSSGRIRDILTIDGGIERLVCILKEGRSKKMMAMWKWNLAFQCIVNIGVRGSETVRTRVVEADMVPVIATILDNYFQVIDKCKERAELESKRKCTLPSLSSRSGSRTASTSRHQDAAAAAAAAASSSSTSSAAATIAMTGASSSSQQHRSERSRRHAPPSPIAIPQPQDQFESNYGQTTPAAQSASLSLSSPPERTTFARQQSSSSSHHHHRSYGHRSQFASSSRQIADAPMSATTIQSNTHTQFGIRPVRDVDTLPSMLPTQNAESSSQPQSPTTPSATPGTASATPTMPIGRTQRPSIRHQLSISGSEDGGHVDDIVSDASNELDTQGDTVDVQSADIVMRDISDEDTILGTRDNAVTFALPGISANDDETFNITHRNSTDGSAVNATVTPTQGQNAFVPTQIPPAMNPLNATPPNMQQTHAWLPVRQPFDRLAPAGVLAAMPRDEDVLMSLQLLAYVSKYCNLRSYFQQTHLVPRLKISMELRLLDADYDPSTDISPVDQETAEDEWDNEFVQKADEKPYNIFPLIEKFTAKPSSSSRHQSGGPHANQQQGDMQYWAGVVMRNLCRKDDSRGGIRQCAYWQCGKWEQYQRQFAKCRRCRRTKYCSKECQKGAWASHRYWCVAADESRDAESGNGGAGSIGGGGERHHSHRHHHHHHHHHHRSHGHSHHH